MILGTTFSYDWKSELQQLKLYFYKFYKVL